MITEDYCNYEVSKLLKEKGFNWDCITYYVDSEPDDVKYSMLFENNTTWEERCCSAPTHQMVCKWLREKDIYVCPKYCCFCGSKKKDVPYFLWEPRILRLSTNNIIYPQPLDMCKHYNSYEEAVEAALKYTLENLI